VEQQTVEEIKVGVGSQAGPLCLRWGGHGVGLVGVEWAGC
jgi:hypothetical protein